MEEGEDYEAEIEMCVRFLRLIMYQGKGKDGCLAHGNRNINANPMASLRLMDMNRPFRRITARKKIMSSVITSTAAINCQRLNWIHISTVAKFNIALECRSGILPGCTVYSPN